MSLFQLIQTHDPNIIDYSKVVLKQILIHSQWKAQPQITKNFSQLFDHQFYNYYDYIEAWDRFLLLQNNIYRHTWFFHFDMYRKKDIMIPRWFMDWQKLSRKNQTYCILRISHIFCSSFIGFQISHRSLDGNTRQKDIPSILSP